MSKTSRVRSRTLRASGVGTIKKYTPISNQTPYATTNYGPHVSGYEYMEDSLSAPFAQNNLLHRRGYCTTSYAFVEYNSIALNRRTKCERVPMVNNVHLRLHRPFEYIAGFPAKQSSTYLAQVAAANANPNAPDIDLPLSIFELKDLPRMLKHLGGLEIAAKKKARRPGMREPTLAEALSESYIAAQFGWAPLIRDLLTLADFADMVDKREAYLRSLLNVKGKRLRRKLLTENLTTSTQLGAFPPDIASSSTAYISCEIKRKYWYTAKVKLVHSIPARDLRTRAIRASLGLQNLSLSTFWESIPWSWLIDWFSSTGTLLNAYRGGLPWIMSDLNVMCRSDVESTATFSSNRPGLVIDPPIAKGTAIEHYRSQPLVIPFPVLRIPYLTGSQLGILLSLFTLKYSRSGGSTGLAR